MPSPFPGMDPFLERPTIFPDFHDRFVSYVSEILQPDMPPPYYAALGRRAWVEISDRYIGPDVSVLHNERPFRSAEGTVAVSEAVLTEPVVIHVPHDERVETFIEIYAGRGADRRLVTVIEVLSPSNKTGGEQGRDLYLRKQRELLQSKTHLLEIDLLRAGLHTTSVPQSRMDRRIAHMDYHVCLHRFDNVEDFFIYPFCLPQRLPTVAVPLLPGDGDVKLDLQAVFNKTYTAGPYPREIDYQHDAIEPPLTESNASFAADCLKAMT